MQPKRSFKRLTSIIFCKNINLTFHINAKIIILNQYIFALCELFSFNENKYTLSKIVLELCALKTSKCKAVYSRTIQI